MTAPGDETAVTVAVAVEPDAAFDVFTREIDQWWQRGPRYRQIVRGGIIAMEAGVGGRLLESGDDGRIFVRGRVTLWEPPKRLVIEWIGANFAPGEKTEVDVVFKPTRRGTEVTVRHSGWANLRPDHPARHGRVGPAFSRSIGDWWGKALTGLREYVEARASGAAWP
ncbi:MAG TPA: SRPBCC domain-containing protein [Polyangiaceae bacterium]|jgi:uncharacterized protein YndB with AHSA1/START domain|nr:SRPBCC domain-containing protein [Polyangiaceae bacterium]